MSIGKFIIFVVIIVRLWSSQGKCFIYIDSVAEVNYSSVMMIVASREEEEEDDYKDC